MLRFVRQQSPIMVHILFWPIIGVFVIWGFERYGDSAGGSAAVVNNHQITLSQFRNTLQQKTEEYSRYMGGSVDDRMQGQLKEMVINQLVGMELVSEQARKMGLHVTDDEVADQIQNIPGLQKDGRFNREYYEGLLEYRHMSPAQFESEMREDLLRMKTDHLFESQVRPSRLAVEKEKQLRSVKMNVAFLQINKEVVAAEMNVSPADVDAYLKNPTNEAEIKKYYDTHEAEFSKPEEVRASHILVKASQGKPAEEAAAKAKIAKIQEALKTKTFEDVAKEYSEDPASKAKGGDLGWFAHDSKVRQFADAAFAQPLNKVGDPVQTLFGFHIIKVVDRHPAVKGNYDDAKKIIAKKMFADERIDKTLADAQKKISTDPNDALRELQTLDKNVKWVETGFFTAADEAIPKLGDGDEVAQAVFSLSEKQPIYPGLVKTPNTVIALKLVKEETAEAPDTSKVSDEIGKDYGRTIFGAWAGSLQSQAKITINHQIVSNGEAESPE